MDNTVAIWSCEDWELLALIDEKSTGNLGGLCFHPSEYFLATRDDSRNVFKIWKLDYNLMKKAARNRTISKNEPSYNIAKYEIPNISDTIRNKIKQNAFDVFISYNSKDRRQIKNIAKALISKNILPWLDIWELQPGLLWQKELEIQITKIKAAAVFIGSDGIGPWQNMEQLAFLMQFIKRGCTVIPVILKDCVTEPDIPVFLQTITWVDFRKSSPDPLEQLIWGIKGTLV